MNRAAYLFALFLLNAPVGSGASVTYLQTDTTTLGNWKGVYGQDGNVIAQHSVLVPGYASFDTAGAINLYLRNLWSNDPRALLKQTYSYSNTERIESLFHTPTSMDFRVGANDSAPHRIALYFADYERSGRSTAVQVIDSAAGTVLDSRQLTNYQAGVYLVYSYSGAITFRITNNNPGQYTPTGSVNAFFWGGDAGTPTPAAPPADTTPPSCAVTKPAAGQQVADRWFVAADASDNVGVVGVQMMLDGKPLLPEWSVPPYTQQWDTTFTANGPHVLTAVARDAAGNQTTSAPVQVVVNNVTAPTGSVTYLGADTVTLGNWKNVYGQDGAAIAQNSATPAIYANFSAGANSSALVDQNSTDPRALQTTSGARVAAYWTTGTTMDFRVGAADGKTHRIAVYFCDYENLGRLTTLRVFDAGTNALLDARPLPLYGNPLYLVYTYTGNLIFRVVNQSPSPQPGATVSAFFWGGDGLPSSAPPPDSVAPSVSFSAPASGATVSGAVTLTAAATDNVAVASVQFQLDAVNIGQPVTAPPFTLQWNSTGAANGSHMLYAVARDAAGNSSSTAIPVTVNNVAASPPAGNGLAFLGMDTTTKGNWKGIYGQDGNFIAEHSYNAPPYSVFNAIDTNRLLIDIWTGDPRAPLKQQYSYSATERVMSQWYSRYSMDFQVSAADSRQHRIAVYFADWQPLASPAAFPQKRSITVQAIRTDTGVVLDTRTLTDYTGGVYLVYSYTGTVTFRVANNWPPLSDNPNANVTAFFWGGSQ